MLATKTFCVEWGPGCGGSSQVVSIFALIWRSEFESCRSVQFIFRKLFEKNENKWSIKTYCVERLASLKQDPMVIGLSPTSCNTEKDKRKKTRNEFTAIHQEMSTSDVIKMYLM